MKLIQKFNGSNFPQRWDNKDNIHTYQKVWIDGVVCDNPYFFTIDRLALIDGVSLLPKTKGQKWGNSYSVDIIYNNDVIHSINCGIDISDYVAKVTQSKTVSRHFDVSDGILADIDSKYLTDFRKAAVIKPYDYKKISDILGLISLDSQDFTGGVLSYPDGIPQPLSKCFN